MIKPIDHTLADTQIGVGYGVTTLPHLRNLGVVGPFEVTSVSDHPDATRHLHLPSDGATRRRAVRPAHRRTAWRRRRIAGRYRKRDVNELMQFYEKGATSGGFEGGVRMALQAMLSSLHFVFRVEETPANVKPGTAVPHQ